MAASKRAAIIMDAATGEVLYEEHADARRYPASLTKMMTLYLLFEALDEKRLSLTSRLPVSEEAAAQPPTKLGLDPGDKITVRDVILGLITKSANDAAVVAAEALGGSEDRFAKIMTARARKLGMGHTTFRNASGLPDRKQVTTARDLAVLSRALIQTFPHYYHLFSTTEFTYDGHTYANHNRLNSWYDGADGIKTGYIRASGFNLATSAIRDNRRLIGVVMGGVSPRARDRDMARLLDAAFAKPSRETEIRQAWRAKRQAEPEQIADATETPKNIRKAALEQPAASEAGDRPDGWGIQVGAFSKSEPALRAAERAARLAPTQLTSATVELAPLQRKKDSLYRARLVGLTEKEARQACRILKRRKVDCLPLGPAAVRAAPAIASAASS